MLKLTTWVFICLVGCLFTACNSQAEPPPTSDTTIPTENTSSPDPASQAQQHMQQGLDQLAQLQNNNERDGVFDQETLKSMFPDNLLGLPKDPASVSTNVVKMGEVEIANGEATYRHPEDRNNRIRVSISDGFGSQAVGMNMDFVSGIDIQDGTKHTYSTQIGGETGIIEFDSADGRGSLTVVHGQTTIAIEGNKLSSEQQLINAYNALPLRGL